MRTTKRAPEDSADRPETQAVLMAASEPSVAAVAASSVDVPAPDMASAYLDMRDPMVSADGHRPDAAQVTRLNWGFFVAAMLSLTPWIAMQAIALPQIVVRAIAPTLAPAAALGVSAAISGFPFVAPLAALVIVGALVSVLANPLIGELSDRTRTSFGRRSPWIGAGGVVCALCALMLSVNTSMVAMGLFWAIMQFGYAMLAVPLAAEINDRVPDKFRPRIERWHGIGVMLAQALGMVLGACGVIVDSLVPLYCIAALFAIGGIASALILPKEPSSVEMPNRGFDPRRVLNRLRPPSGRESAAFWRLFAARVCMMTGVSITGVFVWYIARYWVFPGDAADAPAGLVIIAMAVAALAGTALASWSAGWLSELIDARQMPAEFVVAMACILYMLGLAVAWICGGWPWALAKPAGMVVFALVSGFAIGIYDAIGLELVMDALPDPRRAGHDLGIYAIANAIGLVLAAIVGIAVVGSALQPYGFAALFPVGIIMVLLSAAIVMADVRHVAMASGSDADQLK